MSIRFCTNWINFCICTSGSYLFLKFQFFHFGAKKRISRETYGQVRNFTINTWGIAHYDETAQSFSFRQDELEEVNNQAIFFQADFA